jgi:hypothetical protein
MGEGVRRGDAGEKLSLRWAYPQGESTSVLRVALLLYMDLAGCPLEPRRAACTRDIGAQESRPI